MYEWWCAECPVLIVYLFCLALADRVSMLSPEQLVQYGQGGYVLVSGLIPEETLVNVKAAMWFVLGMTPKIRWVNNKHQPGFL